MAWFLEPDHPDNTWARRGESPFSWLSRSTLPRAAAARAFMNRNLGNLPVESQSQLFAALRTRWASAFFELIVARTLQLLGASIEIEPVSLNGTKVDFLAAFPDGSISVEAVSPVIDGSVGKTVRDRSPLLDIIERHIPSGRGVAVVELPEIGPNDSKKEFGNAVRRLFESIAPDIQRADLIEKLSQGILHLRYWADPPGGARLVFEPPITSWNNTEERIRSSLEKKKRQARPVKGPTILAIHAGGISSKQEDFDLALFGRSVMIDHSFSFLGSRFDPDGKFATLRQEQPVIDGVLAFIRVGFQRFPEPVFYVHPRSDQALPMAFRNLELRQYNVETNSMTFRPAVFSNVVDGIGPIADEL